ncbi:IS110 family transposase, partial [Rhizobium ruizarguesonis]
MQRTLNGAMPLAGRFHDYVQRRARHLVKRIELPLEAAQTGRVMGEALKPAQTPPQDQALEDLQEMVNARSAANGERTA